MAVTNKLDAVHIEFGVELLVCVRWFGK